MTHFVWVSNVIYALVSYAPSGGNCWPPLEATRLFSFISTLASRVIWYCREPAQIARVFEKGCASRFRMKSRVDSFQFILGSREGCRRESFCPARRPRGFNGAPNGTQTSPNCAPDYKPPRHAEKEGEDFHFPSITSGVSQGLGCSILHPLRNAVASAGRMSGMQELGVAFDREVVPGAIPALRKAEAKAWLISSHR